jgi:hypothetical protein
MTTGMASANGEGGPLKPRPISALPSVQARLLAFGAIVIAGICGGLIGYSTVKVGCHGKCATPEGVGGITGAVIATIGVSVIAVLVLRAMGEWRSIKEKRQLELVIAAAGAFTPSGDRPSAADVPPPPGGSEIIPAAMAEPAGTPSPASEIKPEVAAAASSEPAAASSEPAEPAAAGIAPAEPPTAEPPTAEPAGAEPADLAPPDVASDTPGGQDPPV